MIALKKALEDIGFTNVVTYIQSGNVFVTGQSDIDSSLLVKNYDFNCNKILCFVNEKIPMPFQQTKPVIQSLNKNKN